MPWFRSYSTDIRTGIDIKYITRWTGLPRFMIIGAWLIIEAIANDSPERGKLIDSNWKAMTLDDLLFEIEIDEEQGKVLIDAFLQRNMLDQDNKGVYNLPKWDEKQFSSDGSSTDRVRKHRAKKKAERQRQVVSTPNPNGLHPPNDKNSDYAKQAEHSGNSEETTEKRFIGVIESDTETESET